MQSCIPPGKHDISEGTVRLARAFDVGATDAWREGTRPRATPQPALRHSWVQRGAAASMLEVSTLRVPTTLDSFETLARGQSSPLGAPLGTGGPRGLSTRSSWRCRPSPCPRGPPSPRAYLGNPGAHQAAPDDRHMLHHQLLGSRSGREARKLARGEGHGDSLVRSRKESGGWACESELQLGLRGETQRGAPAPGRAVLPAGASSSLRVEGAGNVSAFASRGGGFAFSPPPAVEGSFISALCFLP